MLTRWKQKIAESTIFPLGDGRRLFFPFGPFKGYVIPKRAFEAVLVKALIRFSVGGLISFVGFSVLGVLLNINMDVLLVVGLLDVVVYYFLARRITRKLIGLPPRLSMRVFSSLQDTERLWVGLIGSTLMAVFIGAHSFFAPPRAVCWVFSAIMLAQAVVFAYIICVHNREHSATEKPSLLGPAVGKCSAP